MRTNVPAAKKKKQQVVGEFRRGSILEAARTLFSRHGYEQSSIEAIAHEAGIAKGTVYLYYRSKQLLYKAVLEHNMHQMRTETLVRTDAAEGLRGKIAAFVAARMLYAARRRDFYRILESAHPNMAMLRTQYREFLREPVERIEQALNEALEAGLIRPQPTAKTAWFIYDLTRGTIQRRLYEKDEAPLETDAAQLVDFIWASLTCGVDPAAEPTVAPAPQSPQPSATAAAAAKPTRAPRTVPGPATTAARKSVPTRHARS